MNDPTQAILVWPAVGVGIIVALVWGYKIIPGLYLAQLAVSFLLLSNPDDNLSLQSFGISNIFILIELLRCYLGAFLIRYFVSYPKLLVSVKSILKFFFLAGGLTTLVSTFVFDVFKYFLGYNKNILFNANSLDWWFGDFLGFMIFAPITLMLIKRSKPLWKTRFTTVAIPVLVVLLAVIFIYNKYQVVDKKRVLEKLQITNDLIANKLEQNINWLQELVDNLLYHFIPKGDSQTKVGNYFSSLENSDNGANAIVWMFNDETKFIKTSSSYSQKQFNKLKQINFIKLRNAFKNKQESIHPPFYNKSTDDFINFYEFKKDKEYLLSIFIIHQIQPLLNNLINKFKLENTNILLKQNNSKETITLHEVITRLPKNKILLVSDFLLGNEKVSLVNQPSARYIVHNSSNLSSIIAKIGLLFTGLIGVLFMIITGKNALTKIEIINRTRDLDQRAKNFKNRKIEYQNLIEQHPVTLWRQNLTTKKMSYISDKVVRLYGYPLQRWLEEEDFWINHIHPEDQENIKNTIKKHLIEKKSFELKYRFIKNDSSIAWIKDVININEDDQSQVQLIGLMVDITETYKAKAKQNISESKYRTLFKYATDALVIIDLDDGSFKDYNQKTMKLFGLNTNSKTLCLADFCPPKQPDGTPSSKRLKKIYKQLIQSNTISFEWFMLNHNGQEIVCNVELIKLPDDERNIALADISDITEKKIHEKKINQLAFYDNLTSLPNREYFYSKFFFFHQQAVKNKTYGTIIYLDLDRFKILNDSLGHQAGDELLKLVAQRIRKTMQKKHDFCARLAGDEFIILSKNLNPLIDTTLEKCLEKCEALLESLNEPYQLGTYEYHITPSIGISVFPNAKKSIDQIIHQADIAMYASKAKGKNTITLYQDNMVKDVNERLELEQAIRQAFVNKEFKLVYQLQYNHNKRATSVEALLRWHRLDELNINTEQLVDLIDEIGLTHELGHWVFDQACADLEKWKQKDILIDSVAINVSSKQFHQKTFINQIKSIISNYNIQPSQIIMELTEAVIIEDTEILTTKLNQLKDYGIRIALDDFGTGYSSLAYLQLLPIDQLKTDKLFISDLVNNKASQHIIKTIINLADLLNFELIVEGVETEDQFQLLKSLGCEYFQGYYFAYPVNANEISNAK